MRPRRKRHRQGDQADEPGATDDPSRASAHGGPHQPTDPAAAGARVAYFAEHRDQIDVRLEELEREWDIERVLEANAASISLLGLALAMTADRRWLGLPVVVAGFLLQHAVQGWCPPVPLFRRFGVRTAAEIDHERYALKILRGDFEDASPADGPAKERARRALAAVQA